MSLATDGRRRFLEHRADIALSRLVHGMDALDHKKDVVIDEGKQLAKYAIPVVALFVICGAALGILAFALVRRSR